MRSIPAFFGLLALLALGFLPGATSAVPHPLADNSDTLVKNIVTTTYPSSPPFGGLFSFTRSGTLAYYSDYDVNNGYELWVTDGTAQGTRLVRDLLPGLADGNPKIFDAAGTPYLFANGNLWKTDGTATGTQLIINSQTNRSFSPISGFALGNSLLFTEPGYKLWKTDGTTAGSVLLAEWTAFQTLQVLTQFQNEAYFYINFSDAGGRTELWKSDGTPAGTKRVKTITSGGTVGLSEPLFYADRLYFYDGIRIWRTDGTEAGTEVVTALNPESGDLEVFAGKLYFRYNYTRIIPPNIPEERTSLARISSTNPTPEIVADIAGGPNNLMPRNLRTVGNKLYFIGATQSFWRTDGIILEEVPVSGAQHIYDDRGSMGAESQMTVLANGTIILYATTDPMNSPADYDLWAISGSDAIARKVDALDGMQGIPVIGFTSLGNQVLFSMGQGQSLVVWVSDGTEPGTFPITSRMRELGIDGYYRGSTIQQAIPVQNTLLFNVYAPGATISDIPSLETWVSDGTTAGTFKVVSSTNTNYQFAWNNTGYFLNFSEPTIQLYRTDGTLAGTNVFLDLPPATSIYGAATTPQYLYFKTALRTSNTFSDFRLWRSDGTEAGTLPVVDLPSIASFGDNGLPIGPMVVGNRQFFTINTQATGRELWVSDGTQAGTNMVKDISPGQGSPNLQGFTTVGDQLFFLEGYTISSGFRLWASDGTEAGTRIVKNFGKVPAGLNNPILGYIIDYDGKAFMSGWDTTTWIEPWISDGTEVGTRRVRDINQTRGYSQDTPQPLTGASLPYDMAILSDKVIFSADDGIHGEELWISDGTEAGTTMVKDINPGLIGSGIDSMASFGKIAVFAASSGPEGIELWKTDGTKAGTIRLTDTAPGPASSNPSHMQLVGTTLFFLADDGTTGRELHALQLLELPYRAHLPVLVH